MSADSYIGTMRPFGGSFTIRSWANCQGQLMAISDNTALFSLIGAVYGGDARTSFGLPDFRGRSPLGMGQMPGGRMYQLGMRFGTESTTLSQAQLPMHKHSAVFTSSGSPVTGTLQAATNPANNSEPSDGAYLASSATSQMYYKAGGLSPEPTLKSVSGLSVNGGGASGNVEVADTGGSQPLSIINPLQVVNWQMVLEGVYPSRS